jgi:hypothetical protein
VGMIYTLKAEVRKSFNKFPRWDGCKVSNIPKVHNKVIESSLCKAQTILFMIKASSNYGHDRRAKGE